MFFVLGKLLRTNIFKELSVETLDEESGSIIEPLRDFDVSISTIENICSSLVTNKAAGLDGISSNLFKRCAKSINKSLCQIFEKLRQTGVYPAA